LTMPALWKFCRRRMGRPVTETEQIANAALPRSGGHERRWGRKLTWRCPQARSPVPAECPCAADGIGYMLCSSCYQSSAISIASRSPSAPNRSRGNSISRRWQWDICCRRSSGPMRCV
jgi:hypothetical protein